MTIIPITRRLELDRLLSLGNRGKVAYLGTIDLGDYDDFMHLARAQIHPPDASVLVVAVDDLPPGGICRTVGGRTEFLYDPGDFEWEGIKDELIQVVGNDQTYMPRVYAINGNIYSIPLP